jgi:hypothetical protein
MFVVDGVDVVVVVDDDDELLVESGVVEVVVIVLVLEVDVVDVDGRSNENRHPLAGGRNVAGLLTGGDGRVVGVREPGEVVVEGETGLVLVVEPSAPVVVVMLVDAVAPRSMRSKANPTTSRAASDTFSASRRGQRRGSSSGGGGLGISWRTVTARPRQPCSSTGDEGASFTLSTEVG